MKEKPKMNSIPDLTPPGKNSKPKSVANMDQKAVEVITKAPKADKAPKEPKPAKDPNAPKAPRAPRADYGYRPDALITLTTTEDASKLRGATKTWYDKLAAFNGKKVSEFIEANKGNEKDPPRGWLRHFAQNGFVTLTGGTVPAPKEASEKLPKEESPKTPTTPPAA